MIERILSADGWNDDVLRRGGGFLQSWEWGAFQAASGLEVLRVRDAQADAMSSCVRRTLPFCRAYWYLPRGPLGSEGILKGIAATMPATFIRFEPAALPAVGLKVNDVQPGQTLIADLRQEPEALLAAMHEKWRYNIRLAERKGVRVFMAGESDADALDIFWGLMEETTERDRFRGHDKRHYGLMLETLRGDPAAAAAKPVARLVFAEHDGKVLAANLMLYFGDTAVYLHGASSRERREVMAPHLLHWTAMQDAKRWGFAKYDFWGVAPEGAEDHPWAGITRFKRGFGGAYVSYPGTYDLPVDRFSYSLYALAKKLRAR